MDRAARVALDLLFPPDCGVCGRGGTLLCERCAGELPQTLGRRCERCWMPAPGGRLCRHCLEAPPRFLMVRSPFIFDGGARRLAHELKYEGLTSLAEPMGYLMAGAFLFADVDLVVPVPLHRSRERSRGYNQAAMLARAVAARTETAYDSRALRRVRATAPLTKTMHREERRAIVAGAFAADRRRVEGRRVLLVDDVVTTGATLDSVAGALLDGGAEAVRCLTWGRAD